MDVEVLEEGSKGFLGIGAKPYRLRLTKKDTPALRAEEFLQNVDVYKRQVLSFAKAPAVWTIRAFCGWKPLDSTAARG